MAVVLTGMSVFQFERLPITINVGSNVLDRKWGKNAVVTSINPNTFVSYCFRKSADLQVTLMRIDVV